MPDPIPIVGIVGLGAIGEGVFHALVRRGYRPLVYDVRPEVRDIVSDLGEVAASSRTLAEAADVVLIAVYDDAQLRAVVAGGQDAILAAESCPRAIVLLSTVTLETVLWAAETAKPFGVGVLDCGVTGGDALRNRGEIVAMVGGDDALLSYVRPVLETFGSPVIHAGPLGNGMRAKLVRNLITFGSWFVALEAARLAVASEIDVETIIRISEAGDRLTGGSVGILKRGIRPGPPLHKDDRVARDQLSRFIHKDLRAAIKLAEELRVELPVARFVEEAFDDALGRS